MPNFPSPGDPRLDPRVKTTLTDANGFYQIDGLTEATSIDAEKDGYEPTGYGAFTGNRVINMTMNRRLRIAGGETLHATIWGDSEMSGEDWTGADCDSKAWACEIIHVITSGPGMLTARLNWSDPGNELGVFISTGWFGGQGSHGSSPREASLDIRAGETLVVVSFEKSAGSQPIPDAGQSFDLATAFVPR